MRYIDPNLPIYVRITEKGKDYFLLGEFKEEQQLPSTTVLSKKFGINVATINKALAILIDEGLVYKKRGIGMFVKKGARAKLVKERRKRFKQDFVDATIQEARMLDYSIEELKKIAKDSYVEHFGVDPDKDK